MPTVRLVEVVTREFTAELNDEYFIRDESDYSIIDLTEEGRDKFFNELAISFWDHEEVIDAEYDYDEDQ